MSHSSATTITAPGKDEWDGGVSPMGVSYGKLMMWFFLLSDAFTFSGLLITYGLVRSAHHAYTGSPADYIFSTEYWPIPEKVFDAVPFLHGVELPLVFVGIMTFVLIMSSVTMVLAVEAGHRMDRKAVEKWMLWTILGGLAFLSCQAWEWTHFIVGADAPTLVKDFVKGEWVTKEVFWSFPADQPIWASGLCRFLFLYHWVSRLSCFQRGNVQLFDLLQYCNRSL